MVEQVARRGPLLMINFEAKPEEIIEVFGQVFWNGRVLLVHNLE